jgi:hypothetical protein
MMPAIAPFPGGVAWQCCVEPDSVHTEVPVNRIDWGATGPDVPRHDAAPNL